MYQPKVYHEQGGARLVVASGGEVKMLTGGKFVPNSGTQAAAIADVTAITGGESPTEAEHNLVITAVNAALAALRGAGIIAAA